MMGGIVYTTNNGVVPVVITVTLWGNLTLTVIKINMGSGITLNIETLAKIRKGL